MKVEQAEQFRLAYPDGPHNAEAMFVDPESRELYIVTKEPQGARLYAVALDALKDRVRSELKLVGRVEADNVSAGRSRRMGAGSCCGGKIAAGCGSGGRGRAWARRCRVRRRW